MPRTREVLQYLEPSSHAFEEKNSEAGSAFGRFRNLQRCGRARRAGLPFSARPGRHKLGSTTPIRGGGGWGSRASQRIAMTMTMVRMLTPKTQAGSPQEDVEEGAQHRDRPSSGLCEHRTTLLRGKHRTDPSAGDRNLRYDGFTES